MTEREFAIEVVQRLHDAGYESYWAGGCVRDQLLNLEPADYDVATAATPDQVKALFRRTVEVGLSFGVVEVLGPQKHKIQVATFRNDGNYSDGRRPDSVSFSSAEEDADRRDFTINGLFFDPLQNRVIDFVSGQKDLENRILRAIGKPRDRFREDKLRMLRAVRLAARFQLEIEAQTAEAIREMAPQIDVVSPERIAEEFRKMLVNAHRARALDLLFELHLALPIFPEFSDPRFHREEVTEQLKRMTLSSFEVAFSLLFGFLRPVPSEMPSRKTPIHDLCRRLKLSNEERERIEWLVKNQDAFRNLASQPFSRYQPLVIHPGIQDLLELHKRNGLESDAQGAEAILRDYPPEKLNPVPLITGEDLLERNVPAGPKFKEILQTIRNQQLDKKLNDREEALRCLDKFITQ
jgi:poly(A) polymerase